jgi:hypothetical protein
MPIRTPVRTLPACVVALAALAAVPLAAAPVDRPIDRAFDAGTIQVDLENLVGEVTLVAAAGPSGRISGTIHAEDSGGRSADTLAAALDVRFDESAGRLVVRAGYPLDQFTRYHYPRLKDDVEIHPDWLRSLFDFSGSSVRYHDRQVRVSSHASSGAATLWADFRIEVPAGVFVKVRNAVGQIRATGVAADLNLDISAGGIDARGGKGELLADTGSGDVSVRDHEGRVSADTGSGDVSFEQVRGESIKADTGSGNVALLDCAGSVDADTGSGDIRARGVVYGRKLRADTGSGNVRLEGDFAAVRDLSIDTGSGDVVLEISSSPSLRLDISTGSGDIEVDLADTRLRRSHGDVVAEVGAAEGKGVIDTGSGDVTLRGR